MSGLPHIDGLTERVQWQRREMTGDEAGGHSAIYVPMLNLWARVKAVGAREAQLADGRSVAISHTVVIRFRGGIDPGDRFLYRGRHLNVVSAEDISGKRHFLACRCNETAVVG